MSTKGKLKVVSKGHVVKLGNFRKRKAVMGMRINPPCTLNIPFTLSFGLHHHIPNFANYNAVETEFELFYQNILSNISDIPKNELRQLKSKL